MRESCCIFLRFLLVANGISKEVSNESQRGNHYPTSIPTKENFAMKSQPRDQHQVLNQIKRLIDTFYLIIKVCTFSRDSREGSRESVRRRVQTVLARNKAQSKRVKCPMSWQSRKKHEDIDQPSPPSRSSLAEFISVGYVKIEW